MKAAPTLLAALLLTPLATLHAANPTSAENSAAMKWANDHVFAQQAKIPFSFTLGGKSAGEAMRDWKQTDASLELNAQRRELARSWKDGKSGLEVRLVATEYVGYPVVEWTVWLKNGGNSDTALIENIQGFDVGFERSGEGEFVLHGVRGDTCVAESFRPFALTLGPDAVKRCSPPVAGDKVSGKSSDGPDGWPYWNLQRPGGGVILAVGWPGQWEATFTRDHERGLRVKAGQQLTRLVLKPGEEIRTPSITLLFWQGDDVVRAQNLWRSWYLAHVLPRIGGRPQSPTTQIQTGGSLANWPSVQAYIDAGIKPDICWRDAGGSNPWYPITDGPFTDPKKIWLTEGHGGTPIRRKSGSRRDTEGKGVRTVFEVGLVDEWCFRG